MISLILTMYSVSLLIYLYLYIVIKLFVKKTRKFLHIILLWGYLIFLFFFTTILQYYKFGTIVMYSINLTDYYCNSNMNNFYESNLVIKKNIFLDFIKNHNQHVLSFNTYSNYNTTYYFTVRNNQLYLLYIEEFVFLAVIVVLVVIFILYKSSCRCKGRI